MCPDIDLGKNLLLKIFRKNICKTIYLSGADSCVSPVKGNIQRTFAKPDNRIGLFLQKPAVFILTHLYRAPDLISLP